MVEPELDAFRNLFRGRDDVWGSIQGKSNKEPVTAELYEAHLNGTKSIGIYPLLDNGKCYFFALDLDVKDFGKARALRQAFADCGVPVYIAMSKGKGYHIFGFAETIFVAKDVRELCHRILLKTGLSTEVFPKQDKLDDTIKYGNYINLPCCGDRRQFVDVKHQIVPREIALQKITKIPTPYVQVAIDMLPKKETSLPVSVRPGPKKTKKGRAVHPPCISSIIKGTGQGQRDEAAFALARHYLDQSYLPEEVMSLLSSWDLQNNPPLNDPRLLETKIRSAEQGYAFGCASIQKGLLSNYCVTEAKCEWLKTTNKEKRKAGLIKEVSFFENEDWIYEEVIEDGEPLFIGYNEKTGELKKTARIEMGDMVYEPIYADEIVQGAVLLPSGTEEYGSLPELVSNIKKHIVTYLDLPGSKSEFAAWYIILSWVYDKLTTVNYFRFIGDTGTGKSRALDVVGRLCYKPMICTGAVTPAPIYRIISRYRGSLVLDEADFTDSSEKAEVVKILNSGFELGRPVMRCNKDDPEQLMTLVCFGPKVLSSRRRFADKALEGRCFTVIMTETSRDDIPALLGEAHKQREMSLRNQLLLWRLRSRGRIDARGVEDIDIGTNLQRRLRQIALPFAIPFKDMPEVLDRFKDFLQEYNKEQTGEMSESRDGQIVYSFFTCAEREGRDNVTSNLIKSVLEEVFKIDKLSAQSIGAKLKNLGMHRVKRRVGGKVHPFWIWERDIMDMLRRRYVPDADEFTELFALPPGVDSVDSGISENVASVASGISDKNAENQAELFDEKPPENTENF